MPTTSQVGKLRPMGNLVGAFAVEFTHADASCVVSIPVEKGSFIKHKDVATVVGEAFDGATPALLIGVTGDTDALMNATSTAIGTISDAAGTEPKIAANAEDNLNGYYFKEDGNILITFTAAAVPTTGKAIVVICMSNVQNSGITPA